MTVENQLESLMEDTVDSELMEAVRAKLAEKELLEAKKESKEDDEKKEDEEGKSAADAQEENPAVSIDNPINPDLNASSSDDEVEDADDASVKSVKESVEELLGDEFSEDFKLKAVVIFEAAVKDQVMKIEEALKQEYATKAATLQEEFDSKLSTETAKIEESLSDEINGYLTTISEEWMTKNELAVIAGVKAELVESFIGGMKTLFEEHYVDLPEEKFDLVGKLEEEKNALSESLADANAKFEALTEQHNSVLRGQIITESAKEFTALDFERFKSLTEDFAFDNEDTFRKKVDIVKTAFFEAKAERRVSKKEELVESLVASPAIIEEQKLSAEPTTPSKMDEYIRYVGKAKRA